MEHCHPVSPTKPSPKSWKSVKIGQYRVGKMSKLDNIVLEKCNFPRLFLIKQHFIIVEIKHQQRCVCGNATLGIEKRNVRF